MMSLKPRQVDFQETWANLKETVRGVVRLQGVRRAEWAARFSDVYALCVAQPDPLAARLYAETRTFLEQHVAGVAAAVRGDADLAAGDPHPDDGLLLRYVTAWQEYSQGVSYLNSLYSYLNLQHIKRQKVSDAEIIYGSASAVSGDEDTRQLEIGELGLCIWERVVARPLAPALAARVVAALTLARAEPHARPALALQPDQLEAVVASFSQTCAWGGRTTAAATAAGGRASLAERALLQPWLAAVGAHHAAAAAAALAQGVSHYMQHALDGLAREDAVCARYLRSVPGARAAVRAACAQAGVGAHLDALHAAAPPLLARAASADPAERAAGRADLQRLYALVRPLDPAPLVQAARDHVARAAQPLLDTRNPAAFVECVVNTHATYAALFAEVFEGAAPFLAALDQACSELVNSTKLAPELLQKYCDALLRRRAGACERDTEARLEAAVLVFKYIDDKDVFQKHYAVALARRLISQLSLSMEQEEAMINRLKAACGYEYTNKLHRMFTDIAVSADLLAQFQQYVRERNLTLPTGLAVQVLQAGAWPLQAGGGAPPPPALDQGFKIFQQFYASAFSGRRLALLQPLCSGELRYRPPAHAQRPYTLTATTHQVSILLVFEAALEVEARGVKAALQLEGDAWRRQLRPLLEAKLLTHRGEVESEECEGWLVLNSAFASKRTRIRLTAAATYSHGSSGSGEGSGSGAGSGSGGGACDDDRKMYLQAAIVRIMKQRKVLSHAELVAEAAAAARGQFAPGVALVKKCIEALIDKQFLERVPGQRDAYCYLA